MDGTTYTIFNVHGLWNGRGKTDTDERIAQSQRIRECIDLISGPKIVCGDFNLRPDTQSLTLIAHGMNDLIKTFGVASTRTSLYPKAERFADYIFVTPDITVKKFAVLPDVVSDHAPLLLEI
jgi:endonuclease/exonuclease/phosphatase family metal-dependent hydrolase